MRYCLVGAEGRTRTAESLKHGSETRCYGATLRLIGRLKELAGVSEGSISACAQGLSRECTRLPCDFISWGAHAETRLELARLASSGTYKRSQGGRQTR